MEINGHIKIDPYIMTEELPDGTFNFKVGLHKIKKRIEYENKRTQCFSDVEKYMFFDIHYSINKKTFSVFDENNEAIDIYQKYGIQPRVFWGFEEASKAYKKLSEKLKHVSLFLMVDECTVEIKRNGDFIFSNEKGLGYSEKLINIKGEEIKRNKYVASF